MTAPQGRERLEALLQRVEAATGPDRELDVWIWLAAVNPSETGAMDLTLTEAIAQYPDNLEQIANWWGWGDNTILKATASVDTALALVERVFPGIDAAQMLHEALECLANTGWRDDRPIAPQIALALVAALLRALIARTPTPGETND